jgi:hypothetical protein
MTFDPRALFANLVERERVHGHHSPEGQAIRTLSRALDGWSSGNLAGGAVIVLCGQAIEDWLKRRLGRSPWSAPSLSELLAAADAQKFLAAGEVEGLQKVAAVCAQSRSGKHAAGEIEAILETTIEIIAHHWS